MKRTLKMTFAYFLFIFSAILGIAVAIFDLSTYIRIFAVVMVAISIVEVVKLAYCPYCGNYSIRVQPFLKQNPSCKKCGKQL